MPTQFCIHRPTQTTLRVEGARQLPHAGAAMPGTAGLGRLFLKRRLSHTDLARKTSSGDKKDTSSKLETLEPKKQHASVLTVEIVSLIPRALHAHFETCAYSSKHACALYQTCRGNKEQLTSH